MTPIIYPGKARAAEMKADLKKKIASLKKETGVTPKLVILKVNNTKATDIFTRLKQKAAEEVGAEVEIYEISSRKNAQDIMSMISYIDRDEKIHGIMVQLPFPKRLKYRQENILKFIPAEKDVDGLNDDSDFQMPVTKAILDAVEDYQKKVAKKEKLVILVMGCKGIVGSNVTTELKKLGHTLRGVDKSKSRMLVWQDILKNSLNLDLIITATGKAGLLHDNNAGEGIGIIDVGAPEPEADFESLKNNITYITPVPGGIGPVTISYLLENLYQAAYNQTHPSQKQG